MDLVPSLLAMREERCKKLLGRSNGARSNPLVVVGGDTAAGANAVGLLE